MQLTLENVDDVVNSLIAAVRDRTPVALIGKYGSGKIMIARRLASLCPAPEGDVRAQWLQSLAHCGLWTPWLGHPAPEGPAFRAPHHTASTIGLAGSARPTPAGFRRQPSEVDLALGGVLLLDDLDEFSPQSIQALALQPGLREVSLIVTSAEPSARFHRQISVLLRNPPQIELRPHLQIKFTSASTTNTVIAELDRRIEIARRDP